MGSWATLRLSSDLAQFRPQGCCEGATWVCQVFLGSAGQAPGSVWLIEDWMCSKHQPPARHQGAY